MISICVLVVVSAGCDTGDGKQLQPYDPADYPSPVVDTTIAEDLASEFVVDPTVSGDPDVAAEPFSVAAPWLDGADIDPRYTCDGLNVSPAVSWGAVPTSVSRINLMALLNHKYTCRCNVNAAKTHRYKISLNHGPKFVHDE